MVNNSMCTSYNWICNNLLCYSDYMYVFIALAFFVLNVILNTFREKIPINLSEENQKEKEEKKNNKKKKTTKKKTK